VAAIFTLGCLAFVLDVATAGVVVLARIGDWKAALAGLPPWARRAAPDE
jgi:hypothetical protein